MIGEGHGAVRLVDTSGNTIQLDTSGRVTIAGGSITASISGDTVIAKISGETLIVNNSGSTVIAKVSGEPVALWQASGRNGIYITDQSGATPARVFITTSDAETNSNVIAVGAYLYATRVTGFHARLKATESGVPMSGVGYKLAVDFSGAVATISGNAVTTSISGNAITASGDTYIAKVSGEVMKLMNSGAVAIGQTSNTATCNLKTPNNDVQDPALIGLSVVSFQHGFREASTSGWARLRVTESGQGMSGINYKLAVDFSGAVATVSGNAVNMAAQTVTAPTWLVITGNSGGTTLSSQACTMVRIMNLSGNGTMLIGGTGTAAPVSGTKGIPLWPASLNNNTSEMDFPVTNANLLAVVAHTSGNSVSYMTFG